MNDVQTIEKLYDLRLGAMAEAFREELGRSGDPQLSFAERVGLIVERQWAAREEGRLTRRLKAAQLKIEASVEETDLRTPLRSGADDLAIEALIREAVAGKRMKHEIGEPGFVRSAKSMSQIGG